MPKEETLLKIRVRNGDREIATEMPLTPRAKLVVDKPETMGHGVLEMVEKLVIQLNKID